MTESFNILHKYMIYLADINLDWCATDECYKASYYTYIGNIKMSIANEINNVDWNEITYEEYQLLNFCDISREITRPIPKWLFNILPDNFELIDKDNNIILRKDVVYNINLPFIYYKVNSKDLLKPRTTEDLKILLSKLIKERGVNADLNDVDVSEITDMYRLFEYSHFNGDISKWEVSKVVNMACIFANSKFNGDISNWNVSKVEDMRNMFDGSIFNRDISKWNVSKVEDMRHMFNGSNFNGDISEWNTSNVKNMNCTFYKSNFNGDISKWDVSKVVNMSRMFYDSPLEKKLPEWYKRSRFY